MSNVSDRMDLLIPLGVFIFGFTPNIDKEIYVSSHTVKSNQSDNTIKVMKGVTNHKKGAQNLQCVSANTKARRTTILLFFLCTIILFSLFYFKLRTEWRVDTGEYKLIVRTKGHVNNLTVTVWIYYFNVSTANISTLQGIKIEPDVYSINSKVQIDFEDFKQRQATITISNMEPMGSIPIDRPYNFTPSPPRIEGELENSTDFFSHLFVSASTPMGKINVYSYSIEAIVKDGKLTWSNSHQLKERTHTVFVWGFIFLSATISSICVTIGSILLRRKSYQTFPIVTLLFASAMCFIYLYVGVGNDFLSSTNVDPRSSLLLSLFSAFFHIDYSHLMNNLLYSFIIGGSLIEIWLLKFHGLNRYLWFFSPLPLSILMSVFRLFLSPFVCPSIGASLWSIGIAVVLVFNILRERSRLLGLTSVWDLVALLLSGYLFISATWNYMAGILIHYYSEESVSLSVYHVIFVIVFVALLSCATELWQVYAKYRNKLD